MLPLVRGLLNLLRLPLLPFWWTLRLLARPKSPWLLVRLRPRIVEFPRPKGFFLRFQPALERLLPTPLSLLRRLVAHVARDPGVRGVVFVVPPLHAGWATVGSVREVLETLRRAGKEVVVHLPRGGGNRELYLATAADRIYLGPQTSFMPLGLTTESRYLRPLLDRVGVELEAFARVEYKTAYESLLRDSMSEPQREQLTTLLATMDRELVQAVAARPGFDEAKARELFERTLLRAEDAVALGLAKGLCYEDELPNVLAPDLPKKGLLLRSGRYLAFREARFFRRLTRAPYVAVVEVSGIIAEEAPLTGSRGADLERMVATLRGVREDRRALGVVLHVDSPGGSALASDLIHREVVRLKEKKPVVAYFGNVAASGGYYVAAGAAAIVAQPLTVTGSIGVLAAKLVARGLLDRLGIRVEVLKTTPHADMFSSSRALDPHERSLFDREIDGAYETFVNIVAEGRGRSADEIREVARGRVWSGRDALSVGLVDLMGGLDLAIEEVRRRIPVPDSVRARLESHLYTPPRLDFPPPEPPGLVLPPPAEALVRLAPEGLDLLRLVSGRDRVLYYAPGIPEID